MLVINILLGIILFIVSIITKLYPPKKINNVYGYRTKMSMKNEETWLVANSYASNLMVVISILSVFLGLLSYSSLPGTTGVLVTYLGTCTLLIAIFIFTERHLVLLFDKEGNRKSV